VDPPLGRPAALHPGQPAARVSVLTADTAYAVRRWAAMKAERAEFELVMSLVEEWAELQTERLMREILGRPVMFHRDERDHVALET
jgi:hypothetical protein